MSSWFEVEEFRTDGFLEPSVSMCHPNINLKYLPTQRLDHRSRVLKEKYCVILTQDFQFKVTVSFV